MLTACSSLCAELRRSDEASSELYGAGDAGNEHVSRTFLKRRFCCGMCVFILVIFCLFVGNENIFSYKNRYRDLLRLLYGAKL